MSSPETSNFQTLEGKVAIVTGASRGLGLGFAFELARRGAKVLYILQSKAPDTYKSTGRGNVHIPQQ